MKRAAPICIARLEINKNPLDLDFSDRANVFVREGGCHYLPRALQESLLCPETISSLNYCGLTLGGDPVPLCHHMNECKGPSVCHNIDPIYEHGCFRRSIMESLVNFRM